MKSRPGFLTISCGTGSHQASIDDCGGLPPDLGCEKFCFVSFDAAISGSTDECHYNNDGTYDLVIFDEIKDERKYKVIARSLKKHIEAGYLCAKWITPEGEHGTEKQADHNGNDEHLRRSLRDLPEGEV